MSDNTDKYGIPLFGDRSAWNVDDYPSYHASDLEAANPVYHLPTSETDQIPVWDGTKWVGTDLSEMLAENLSPQGKVVSTAYGDASPITIYTIPTGFALVNMSVEVDITWDGTGAAVEIGIVGDTDLFFASTELDLTELCEFEKTFTYDTPGNVIITVTPGTGATQGHIKVTFDALPIGE